MTALAIDSSNMAHVYCVENRSIVDGSITYPRDLKFALIELDDTVDATDYVYVTLSKYGMKRLLGLYCWVHTANNSIVTIEADTCTVNEGVVTVTIAAGTDNDKRVIMLIGV